MEDNFYVNYRRSDTRHVVVGSKRVEEVTIGGVAIGGTVFYYKCGGYLVY